MSVLRLRSHLRGYLNKMTKLCRIAHESLEGPRYAEFVDGLVYTLPEEFNFQDLCFFEHREPQFPIEDVKLLAPVTPSKVVCVGRNYREHRWLAGRGVSARTGGSVMRNRVDIDYTHSRAIIREVGKTLQADLKVDPELPASLRTQIDRLRRLEGQSPPTVSTERWRKRHSG